MKKGLIVILLFSMTLTMAFANGSAETASAPSVGISGTVEKPKVLRAGTSGTISTDPTSPFNVAFATLKGKMEELSGGKITLEVVGGGALGNNTQLLAQLRQGTLDLMPTGFDLATNLQKSEKFNAVSMPYVFDNDEHMDAFLQSDLWRGMVSDLAADNGVYISGIFMHQPARIFNTKRPIVHPSDLAGFKLRVPESTVQMNLWKATGASPMVVPVSELYSGLDSGIVDGQENDIVSSFALKMYEVAPYFTETDYIKQGMFMYMSQKTWNAMSELEKSWWNEALAAACKAGTEAYGQKLTTVRALIQKGGGTLVEFDFDEWKNYFSELVHREFDGKIFPAGLYDQIQATPY